MLFAFLLLPFTKWCEMENKWGKPSWRARFCSMFLALTFAFLGVAFLCFAVRFHIMLSSYFHSSEAWRRPCVSHSLCISSENSFPHPNPKSKFALILRVAETGEVFFSSSYFSAELRARRKKLCSLQSALFPLKIKLCCWVQICFLVICSWLPLLVRKQTLTKQMIQRSSVNWFSNVVSFP